MTQKLKQKKSWLDLIKFLFNFFLQKNKEKEAKKKDKFVKTGKKLEEKYIKIVKDKEKKKNETQTLDDIQDNLNKRF